MSKMKILVSIGVLASAVAVTKGAQTAPLSWGEAVNGLQMSISRNENVETQDKAMGFRVEFRNTGQDDISIRPGMIFECGGQRGDTDAIKLTLTDSHGTPHRHLPFLGNGPPYASGCGGGAGTSVNTWI